MYIYSDTSIVPPIIYAFLASSREIVIGPVTVDSLLLSSMIQTLKDPVNDSTAYTQLVLTATFFTGVFQVAFGFLRFALRYLPSLWINNLIKRLRNNHLSISVYDTDLDFWWIIFLTPRSSGSWPQLP